MTKAEELLNKVKEKREKYIVGEKNAQTPLQKKNMSDRAEYFRNMSRGKDSKWYKSLVASSLKRRGINPNKIHESADVSVGESAYVEGISEALKSLIVGYAKVNSVRPKDLEKHLCSLLFAYSLDDISHKFIRALQDMQRELKINEGMSYVEPDGNYITSIKAVKDFYRDVVEMLGISREEQKEYNYRLCKSINIPNFNRFVDITTLFYTLLRVCVGMCTTTKINKI